MKRKITLFFAALLMSFASMAQSPNMINYQGVARDSMGNAIANQQIKLRLKIHSGTSTGPVLFTHTKTVTTSSTGLFNLQINGPGGSLSGIFENITWATDKKYLQVEMDPNGGSNYTNLGTQQLVSVPYALDAQKAEKLVMPYSQTDSMTNDLFYIENKNYTAIHGKSTNYYGVHGQSTNNYGVFGTTAHPGYAAVYGQNFSSGIGVNGYSGTGKGVVGASSSNIGVQGSSSSGVGVSGSSSSSYGVYGLSTNNFGVYGESTNFSGLKGKATGSNGIGVTGESNQYVGVYGFSSGTSPYSVGIYGEASGSASSVGIYGNSNFGTALMANSSNGYGLSVYGKVKISGGNTNPGAGKILTSDASGNATWQVPAQAPKVAFKAAANSGTNALSGTPVTVNFANELYDLSNSFDLSTDVFTAPVAGIYNFSAATVHDLLSFTYNLLDPHISIVRNRNGVITILAEVYVTPFNETGASHAYMHVSTDADLQVGDMVYVQVKQHNINSLTSSSSWNTSNESHYFTGHLVTTN